MLRLMAANRLDHEWEGIAELHAQIGAPLPAGERERIAAWLDRNSGLFHLYEEGGQLAGYASLIPIDRRRFDRRVAGAAGLPAAPEEILTAQEHAAARWDGVWIWMERFVAVTPDARRRLVEHVWHALGRIHLKGLLVTPQDAEGEAIARWLGLVEVRPSPTDAPTRGTVWYADAGSVAPTPEQPLGPATPARCLFLLVEERFGPSSRRLELTPTERRVARLFYGEDCEADQIARVLGVQPGTVKTHLQRIRRKAEPIVGSRLSRRIAAYLAEHPGEMAETGAPPLK
jgi:DNA-binding CsgD family transcriptional regulator